MNTSIIKASVPDIVEITDVVLGPKEHYDFGVVGSTVYIFQLKSGKDVVLSDVTTNVTGSLALNDISTYKGTHFVLINNSYTTVTVAVAKGAPDA